MYLAVEGYKRVDASAAGLIGVTELIFGILYGVIFFSEHITFATAAGCGLLVLAASLPTLTRRPFSRSAVGDSVSRPGTHGVGGA